MSLERQHLPRLEQAMACGWREVGDFFDSVTGTDGICQVYMLPGREFLGTLRPNSDRSLWVCNQGQCVEQTRHAALRSLAQLAIEDINRRHGLPSAMSLHLQRLLVDHKLAHLDWETMGRSLVPDGLEFWRACVNGEVLELVAGFGDFGFGARVDRREMAGTFYLTLAKPSLALATALASNVEAQDEELFAKAFFPLSDQESGL